MNENFCVNKTSHVLLSLLWKVKLKLSLCLTKYHFLKRYPLLNSA